MGASLVYLEKANTDKHSYDDSNDKFSYGVWEMQGWRLNMEDACITNLEFDKDTALFGVFDGHGGKEASMVVKDNLERIIKSQDLYKDGKYEKALYEGFWKMDDFLDGKEGKRQMMNVALADPEAKSPLMKLLSGGGEEGKTEELSGGERTEESFMLDSKGCTANVIMIKGDIITVANAGDSRCVIASEGRAENLSEDHKPENEIERARIYNAGSEIVEGRVDGNLNLSRSLGDLKHKTKVGLTQAEQPITCCPDTRTRKILPKDDFIVMAWDGIWEVKTSQEIVDFIYERIRKDMKLSKIVEQLLDSLLSPDYTVTAGLGCDNMSCLIIKLRATIK